MQVKTKSNKYKAFTIVELLTVMSIIIILIGLLVPALSQVKRFAREVKQRAQFHSIDVAMEMFEKETGEYPPSGENDADGAPYCGAMKLAEAMVGQDLLGFHRDSGFRADFMDPSNTKDLYGYPGKTPLPEDLKGRLGPYLELQNANATRLTFTDATGSNPYETGIWKEGDVGVFNNIEKVFVLCDVYTRRMTKSGDPLGMPILYYKANTSGDYNPNPRLSGGGYPPPANRIRFYRHEDNDELLKLQVPWDDTLQYEHPMASNYTPGGVNVWPGLPDSFYFKINNDSIPVDDGRPIHLDSYILLSAGNDGLYGTRDDIYNFQK